MPDESRSSVPDETPSQLDVEPLLSDPARTAGYIDHLEGDIDLRIELVDKLLNEVATRDRRIVDASRELEAANRELVRLRRLANRRWVRFGQRVLTTARRLRALPNRTPREATASKPAGGATITPAAGAGAMTPDGWRASARAILAGARSMEEGLARIGVRILDRPGANEGQPFEDAITVIRIRDPGSVDRWIETPWFDDVDIVMVPDEATAERVRQATTRIATTVDVLPAIEAWIDRPRIDILVGVPDREVAPAWGDTHFGRGLQRAFARRGWAARLRVAAEWESSSSARADVVLHLFGLREREPRDSQLNVLWVISHPDRVTDELVRSADYVYVASDRFARTLSERTGGNVQPLHQATDPARFQPVANPRPPHRELIFVANSRGVRRRIIADLTPTTWDLAIHGRKWRPLLVDPRHVASEGIPNAELPAAYADAAIVLNDHWDDMRRHGFLSNRLYDALAAGAFVISDHVDGIEEEFDDAVVTYRTPRELRRAIEAALADPGERRRLADIGRRAVLARHTFDQRVDRLLADLGPALAARRSSDPSGR